VWLVNFRARSRLFGVANCVVQGLGIFIKFLPLADGPQWLPAGTGARPTRPTVDHLDFFFAFLYGVFDFLRVRLSFGL
jgi:hypothetical protein